MVKNVKFVYTFSILTKFILSGIVFSLNLRSLLNNYVMKKIGYFLLFLFFYTLLKGTTFTGWMGLNSIQMSTDTDMIEFIDKSIEVRNRFDIESDISLNGYSVGGGYGFIQPASISEYMFKGAIEKKYNYSLSMILKTMDITSGISIFGSKHVYVNDIPFLIDGGISIFKNYAGINGGLKYSYAPNGNIKLKSMFIDVKESQIKKMVGVELNQVFGGVHKLRSELRYSTKNGYEILAEPHFRAGDLFYIAVEGYLANKNNSSFGLSLVYSPARKKKVVKEIVKDSVPEPVIEEPEEEPEEEPQEVIIEEEPEEEPEEIIHMSPQVLKSMLEEIVNGPYKKGVDLYVEDKFAEAIRKWSEALDKLNNPVFNNCNEALDYRERCRRNIENAKKKLEIIGE